MKVTDVQIVKFESKTNTKAFANITLDEVFVVKGLRVVEGKKGLFVSMPSSKGSDGEYHDDAFPLTKEFREDITEMVLEAYEDAEDEKPKKKRR